MTHACIVVDHFGDGDQLLEAACRVVKDMPQQVTLIGCAPQVAQLFKDKFIQVATLEEGAAVPDGATVVQPQLSLAQEAVLDRIKNLIAPNLQESELNEINQQSKPYFKLQKVA